MNNELKLIKDCINNTAAKYQGHSATPRLITNLATELTESLRLLVMRESFKFPIQLELDDGNLYFLDSDFWQWTKVIDKGYGQLIVQLPFQLCYLAKIEINTQGDNNDKNTKKPKYSISHISTEHDLTDFTSGHNW
jgi:hypothetical protein